MVGMARGRRVGSQRNLPQSPSTMDPGEDGDKLWPQSPPPPKRQAKKHVLITFAGVPLRLLCPAPLLLATNRPDLPRCFQWTRGALKTELFPPPPPGWFWLSSEGQITPSWARVPRAVTSRPPTPWSVNTQASRTQEKGSVLKSPPEATGTFIQKLPSEMLLRNCRLTGGTPDPDPPPGWGQKAFPLVGHQKVVGGCLGVRWMKHAARKDADDDTVVPRAPQTTRSARN